MRVLFWVLPLVLVSAGCGSSSPANGPDEKQPSNHEQPADDGNDLSAGSKGAGSDTGGTSGTGGTNPQTGMGGSGGVNQPTGICPGWSSSPVARVDVGDTNDTMSAVRAREALQLGFAPSPAHVRAADFFNYYAGTAQAPAGSSPVITLELRERVVPAQYDLLVTLRAPAPPRPRSVFTVVVDTTPSMAGIPLARAQMAVKALGNALVAGDALHILTTDLTQGSKSFDLTGQAGELQDVAAWLDTSSGGDLFAALTEAYAFANAHRDPAAQNRVVLISDGAEPSAALPTTLIDSNAMNEIRLVGVGTGPTTIFRDRLLDEATQYGRGAYAYVDNEAEAEALFKNRFDRLFGVLYDDLRVEVNLPAFLRKIESAVPPDVGSGAPQVLPPGATLRWLVRLESCDPLAYKYYLGKPVTATAYFVDPVTREALPTVTGSVDSTPQPLATSLPALDKALATKAYVEALQSVNKQRVLAALAAVEKAKSANAAGSGADSDLAEMAALLAAHPAKNLP